MYGELEFNREDLAEISAALRDRRDGYRPTPENEPIRNRLTQISQEIHRELGRDFGDWRWKLEFAGTWTRKEKQT